MTDKTLKHKNTEIFERLVKAYKTENAAEIARQLGMTRQSVYQWRDGISAPSYEKLILAASQTGTTIDWLLTGEDKQESNEAQGFQDSIYYDIYIASKEADSNDR